MLELSYLCRRTCTACFSWRRVHRLPFRRAKPAFQRLPNTLVLKHTNAMQNNALVFGGGGGSTTETGQETLAEIAEATKARATISNAGDACLSQFAAGHPQVQTRRTEACSFLAEKLKKVSLVKLVTVVTDIKVTLLKVTVVKNYCRKSYCHWLLS